MLQAIVQADHKVLHFHTNRAEYSLQIPTARTSGLASSNPECLSFTGRGLAVIWSPSQKVLVRVKLRTTRYDWDWVRCVVIMPIRRCVSSLLWTNYAWWRLLSDLPGGLIYEVYSNEANLFQENLMFCWPCVLTHSSFSYEITKIISGGLLFFFFFLFWVHMSRILSTFRFKITFLLERKCLYYYIFWLLYIFVSHLRVFQTFVTYTLTAVRLPILTTAFLSFTH